MIWRLRRSMLILVAALTLAPLISGGVAVADSSAAVSSTGDDSFGVELVGQLGGTASDVIVRGRYAYLAIGPRLVVLDVSDPAHPVVRGETPPTLRTGGRLSLADDRVYLSVDDGVHVFDVRVPESPSAVGFFALPTPGHDSIAGIIHGRAYIADLQPKLRIVDLVDPVYPVEIGDCVTSRYARDVAVSGQYAYLASGSSGLQVVDLADPTNPRVVGVASVGDASRVTVAAGVAYVIDRTYGLRLFDVSEPEHPIEVGSLAGPNGPSLAVEGTRVYIADHSSGLVIVDVATPARPSVIGSLSVPGAAIGIAVESGTAFVAAESGGLRIVSVADPARPVELGFYSPPGRIAAIAVAGGIAYAADGWRGAKVVALDARDPARPSSLGSIASPGGVADIAAVGRNLFVAEVPGLGPVGWTRLGVIDVTDMSHPIRSTAMETTGYTADVLASDGQVFVLADQSRSGAESTGEVTVLDVTGSEWPRELGRTALPGQARGLASRGTNLFVASGEAGLRIYSHADPSRLREVGSWREPGYAPYHVAVVGTRAFLALGSQGLFLRVLDVTDPSRPSDLGLFTTPALSASDMVADERFLYVTDPWRGLFVLDTAGSAGPVVAAFLRLPGQPSAVALDSDYAYVGAGDAGLFIVRRQATTEPEKHVGPIDVEARAPEELPHAGERNQLTPLVTGLGLLVSIVGLAVRCTATPRRE